MGFLKNFFAFVICFLTIASCKLFNKTQLGEAIGQKGGAVLGSVVGDAAGNSSVGTMIGGSLGGATGEAIVKSEMDRQAEELSRNVSNAKVEKVGQDILVEFKSASLFTRDKSSLSPSAAINLDQMVAVLEKYPKTNLIITGYTDQKSNQGRKQLISEKRAVSVANYIKAKGIAEDRVATKAAGEIDPRFSNDNSAGKTRNQRIELLLSEQPVKSASDTH